MVCIHKATLKWDALLKHFYVKVEAGRDYEGIDHMGALLPSSQGVPEATGSLKARKNLLRVFARDRSFANNRSLTCGTQDRAKFMVH